jgi:hypothetical protein
MASTPWCLPQLEHSMLTSLTPDWASLPSHKDPRIPRCGNVTDSMCVCLGINFPGLAHHILSGHIRRNMEMGKYT